MNLLTVQDLEKNIGQRTLFSDVTFQINEGEKVGLVGVNGCGKTTLFRTIMGTTPFDAGAIHKTKLTNIGYMEQHVTSNDQRTAYKAVLDVFAPLQKIERELELLAQQLQQAQPDELDSLIQRQHRLQEEFKQKDGYTYASRARATLLGLGFRDAMLEQPVLSLSGGEKAKVALARLLLSEANLLLLDEPTNHLDMPSVAWLENFLIHYRGAVLIISHDRYFLDRVVTQILEMEHGHVKSYLGNYSTYREKRAKSRETEQKHYDNTMKEIKRLEDVITQQRQWNRERNIRMAESKQKQVDRLEKTLVRPESELGSMKLQFRDIPPCAQDVLTIDDVGKSFEDKKVFDHVTFSLTNGDHVFLLGPNGCGKTTLMKLLMKREIPDHGIIRFGSGVIAGYYDQTHGLTSTQKTILDEMTDALPELSQGEIRNALAAFLFRGDDVFKLIETLSGGERARIALLKLMLSKSNLLLLDEPTNHLDIASREVLEDSLATYEGTLLIISHDRYFINKLSKRILAFTDNRLAGLIESLGDYDDYLAHIQRQSENKTEEATTIPMEVSENKKKYQESKELQRQIRQLQSKIKKTEQTIETNETTIQSLEEKLLDSAIATDYQQAADIGIKIESLHQENEQLMDDWAHFSEELETFA